MSSTSASYLLRYVNLKWVMRFNLDCLCFRLFILIFSLYLDGRADGLWNLGKCPNFLPVGGNSTVLVDVGFLSFLYSLVSSCCCAFFDVNIRRLASQQVGNVRRSYLDAWLLRITISDWKRCFGFWVSISAVPLHRTNGICLISTGLFLRRLIPRIETRNIRDKGLPVHWAISIYNTETIENFILPARASPKYGADTRTHICCARRPLHAS